MNTSPHDPTFPLAELVGVRRRFARSVHLERDFELRGGSFAATMPPPSLPPSGTTGYHLTPSALELLRVLDGAWKRPVDRALTVVGPYGAGKSAFCVFLSGLVSGGIEEAGLLRERDPALALSLGANKHRLLPVRVVGSREPLAKALVRGLRQTLEAPEVRLWHRLPIGLQSVFHPDLGALREVAPREVANLFTAAALVAQMNGWGGLLLLCDELGKFLEYAALHPKDGDIFTLQELAEAATRSKAPLFVIAVLHQNADAYAQKLGRSHQAEWAKVGERFREVPFFPSDTERMDMVGFALEHAPALHLNGNFSRLVAQGAGHLPQSMGERFGTMARAAYPLHPTVLLALPPLFRKTSQSHRSLFNFLAGEEAHALGRFLRDNSYTPAAPPLFMLDALFDYTAETLLGGWSAGGLARLWAEAAEAVDRALNVSPGARRVLKIIALLGLLRDPHLPASPDVLGWALSGTDGQTPDVEAALSELSERRLIAWSRTRGVFRLWEGGDVDVESALETARSGLPAGVTLRAATDRELCPLPRLIARRASFQSGTLRTVETRPCSPGELGKVLETQSGLAVVLCLAGDADEAERAENLARDAGRANVLVAIARESDLLREAALDVAAAGEVAQNTPALQSDRAARRELSARRFESESAFRDEWARLFGPASRGARWFHGGQNETFETGRHFSEFLSRMADDFYPATPVLRNELINRRSLSSAAAAGRRALIEAMLLHPGEARLGIEGFPPEFSMYECLLRAPGLHCPTESGAWAFGPPSNDALHLEPVWNAIGEWIFQSPPQPRALPELWALLTSAPFGLAEGVMPPFLLAFLLAHPNEISLYREGTFVPEPGVPDWEVLLRRPELFAVAGTRLEGAAHEFVVQLGLWLGVPGLLVPVVRELLARAKRLPAFAWKTGQLPEPVRRLRGALENARSPEKLLFEEIPNALSANTLFGPALEASPAAQAQTLANALGEAFAAWTEVYPAALSEARDALLESCDFAPGQSGWEEWRAGARERQGRIANAALAPVVTRAAMPGDDASTLDAVLALVAGKAPRTWSDADRERFALQAQRFGALYQQELDTPRAPTPAQQQPDFRESAAMPEREMPGASLDEREKCDELVAQVESVLRGAPDSLRRAVLQQLLES